MKTRRSSLRSHYDKLNNDLSMQTVLFPSSQKRTRKTVVPETPGNYNVTNMTTCAASVLETPDDFDLDINVANKRKNEHYASSCEGTKIFGESSPMNMTDSSVFEVTPDLKLTNRKGIISILESEYSDANSIKAQNIEHDFNKGLNNNTNNNLIDRNRRKSLVEKILPFDLNDQQELAKKMPLLEKGKRGQKSSFGLELLDRNDQSINRKGCTKRSSCRLSKPRNGTIIFENDNDLDLTEANFQRNIFLQNNLSEAIQSLKASGNHCDVDQIANSSDILLTNKTVNQDPGLSFQQFSTDSIKDLEERMKVQLPTRPTDQFSSTTNFHESVQDGPSPYNQGNVQDSFSATLPVSSVTLLGVVAYVDVRSGSENRSKPVKESLSSLGASISERFTVQVTHVVFKEGSKASYDRATKRGVHLVSPLWVDACRMKLVRVSEALFPISSYPKAHGLGIHAKTRKLKSMQPRDFEEDERIILARIKRRLQSATSSSSLETVAQLPETPNARKENINSPLYGIEHLVTPNGEYNTSTSDASSEESDTERDVPLATRMYNRFMSPIGNSSTPLRNWSHRTPLSPLVNVVTLPASECAIEQLSTPTSKDMQNRRKTRSLVKSVYNDSKNVLLSNENDFPTLVKSLSVIKDKTAENLKFAPDENISDASQVHDVINKARLSILKRPYPSKQLANGFRNSSSVNNIRTNKEVSFESIKSITKEVNNLQNLAVPSEKLDLQITSSLSQSNNRTLSSFSSSSQPASTASRMHRLHTVDCIIPEQDLIVPMTPQSVCRHQSSTIYDNYSVNDSVTQRKAMKRFQKNILPDEAILPLPRKVRRCSLQLTQICSSVSSGDDEHITSVESHSGRETPKGRFSLIPKECGSLEEFQKRKISSRRKTCASAAKSLPSKSLQSICVTSFHSSDLGSVYAIIKSLGDYKVTEEVEERTTHVVCGSERRTLNVLFGIAKGCWILDASWLYESVELLKWAPEEPFELFNFCPGAKEHRLLNHGNAGSTKKSLFSGIGRICVLDSCSPKLSVMRSLLQMCEANLCSTIRSADLLVGNVKQNDCRIIQVSEKWVFDSIQHWKVQDFEKYVINEN